MNSFRPFYDDEVRNEEYKNDISHSLNSMNRDVEECIKETENTFKKIDGSQPKKITQFTAEDIRKRAVDIHYEKIKMLIYENTEKFSIDYTVSSTIAKDITKKLVEEKFKVEKIQEDNGDTRLHITW